jgi:hypothetical protein
MERRVGSGLRHAGPVALPASALVTTTSSSRPRSEDPEGVRVTVALFTQRVSTNGAYVLVLVAGWKDQEQSSANRSSLFAPRTEELTGFELVELTFVLRTHLRNPFFSTLETDDNRSRTGMRGRGLRSEIRAVDSTTRRRRLVEWAAPCC